MTKKIILYFCLISYFLTKFNSCGQNFIQTTSPCPNIFQYASPGYGQLTVPSPQIGEMLLLQVEFIVYGNLLSEDVGSLNLSRSQQETLQMILNHVPYIHYVLRFPNLPNYDILPQIKRIFYNENVICSGPDDGNRGRRTTIKLHNLLYSQRTVMLNRNPNNNMINNNNNRPQVYFPTNDGTDDENDFPVYQPVPTYAGPQTTTFQYVPQRPIYMQQPQRQPQQPNPQQLQPQQPQPQQPQPQQPQPQQPQPQQPEPQQPQPQPPIVQQRPNVVSPPQPIQQPTTGQIAPVPTLPSNVPDEEVCGLVDQRFLTNALIFGGINIIHGTWPWLAAIFVSNSHSLNYQCGGNLVSNRVVVSAAHCFVSGGSTISTTKVNVHLGRHNLNIWEEDGQQRRQASLIKVHDDYMRTDSGSFDADIAVVVLKRVVEYTIYVRPLCLWSGNSDLRQVEGKMGTVVGWGLTESGADETEPKAIDIPIVSQETCLRQSADSFKRITSDRTFCAGSRNQTGPCNGDSGSGLAIKQNTRWALRGIVSVSAATDTVHRKCDLSQFVVFTDAALFVDFIKEYVNLSF